MKLLFSIIFFLLSLTHLISQKEDYIWVWGSAIYDIIIPERRADTTLGASNIDFNYDPVKFYYVHERLIDMAGANASICDTSGALLAYSNGMVIYDGNNNAITDTINNFEVANNKFCNEWVTNNFGNDTLSIPGGLYGLQRVIILPVGNKYYTFYNNFNVCTEVIDKISYSTFYFNQNKTVGFIEKKDQIILRDSLKGSLYAIRHGNGRDWWLLEFTQDNNMLHTFLVDPSGVHYQGKMNIGLEPKSGYGQLCISPDGRYFAWCAIHSVAFPNVNMYFAHFDRCEGILLFKERRLLPGMGLSGGVSFSNDSKYLYTSTREKIYQYNISDGTLKDEKIVAIFDGFYYSIPNVNIQYSVNFCWMLLGPDGRVYIVPSAATQRYLSVMEYPHEEGTACDVRQHSIKMPTQFTLTIPNLPNFRLGPLDGSPCDTLGLDNHPVSRFRYAADTSDHLRMRFTDLSYYRPERWSWDFGDGSPAVTERYPFHRYAQNGTYNVCLTVSNENSSNTTCRTITIGTSSSDDVHPGIKKADISLYPNPVLDDLLLTLGEYIPEYGELHLYDMTGRRVHSQRIWYGQNSVDMSRLSSGMYVGRITDKSRLLSTVKVVKG